jgi:signal transduction histidine kinase
MSGATQAIQIETIPLAEAAEALHRTRPFSATEISMALAGLEHVERVTATAGAVLLDPGAPWRHYWVVIEGESRAERPESDGTWTLVGCAKKGDGFGEVPLLTAMQQSPFRVTAIQKSVLIRITESQFWNLLACCPEVRRVVLANFSLRLQAHQVEALHRQKLVALGTLAAGLMHELHNPGAAARRAAAQLRENLRRLQAISLRSTAQPKTREQLECMHHLLGHTLSGCHAPAMDSLEQADAEEVMGAWLRAAGVENAFAIAPALVAAGLKPDELACARAAFDPAGFSDAINWLEGLVSNASLVCAIEESISRVSDLVAAVKNFAYDDRTQGREIDVHDSLQSTLTILGHKMRTKTLTAEKRFAASPAKIHVRGSTLSQIWTNLIDNAIDASPEGAKIEIATWNEPGALAVSVEDHGAGIPAEVLPHIFDAFFTTKPQGHGTGLGLEIVHRVVTQNFGGTIDVQSQPGNTRFTVRLPA